MRVFYVLYVPDKVIHACLDAMRLICNPAEKTRSHVTVRGPYHQHYRLTAVDSLIHGSQVAVDGIGHFFEGNQNTVFFRCHSPSLRAAWRKPDFDFHPHLTIYDGASRPFAERLLALLNRHQFSFSFTVGHLTPLLSIPRQGSLELASAFDSDMVQKVAGLGLSVDAVRRLNEEQRLELVDKLAIFLSQLKPTADSGEPVPPPPQPRRRARRTSTSLAVHTN